MKIPKERIGLLISMLSLLARRWSADGGMPPSLRNEEGFAEWAQWRLDWWDAKNGGDDDNRRIVRLALNLTFGLPTHDFIWNDADLHEQVREIRRRFAAGEIYSILAKESGFSVAQLGNICTWNSHQDVWWN